MHQQPPKTPLLRSTSSAKDGHVDSSSALTDRPVPAAMRERFARLTVGVPSGCSDGEPCGAAGPG